MKLKPYIVIGVLLLGLVGVVYGQIPDDAYVFYGTITLNGDPMPAGVVITASDDAQGVSDSITVSPAGSYGGSSPNDDKLSITGDENDAITFAISGTGCTNVLVKDTSRPLKQGVTEQLNLLVTAECVTSSSSSSGGGGGGGGGGASVTTSTSETDASIVTSIRESLPSSWGGDVTVSRVGTPTMKTVQATVLAINQLKESITEKNPDIAAKLQQLAQSVDNGEMTMIPVQLIYQEYSIKNNDPEAGDFQRIMKRTLVTAKIIVTEDMPESTLAVLIKGFAKNDVVFNDPQPTLIREGSVYAEWLFRNVKKGTVKEVSYILPEAVTEGSDTAVFVGGEAPLEEAIEAPPTELPPTMEEEPEAEEKSPAPSKKPSPLVGIMIVLGIVVIGLVGYLVMSKPKR